MRAAPGAKVTAVLGRRACSAVGVAVRLTLVVMCSVSVVVAAGCSAVVTGTARPGANLKPRPVTGAVIKDAMLTDAELSQVFDQPFDLDRSPVFGGPAELFWGWPGAKESDCAGLSHILMGETYTNAQVLDVVHELWWDSHTQVQPVVTVISVEEGVVALPTMAAADEMFATFSERWKKCGGARIASGANVFYEVGEVHADASVVEATVENHDQTIRLRESHAVGVRDNCIVEVSITYFRDTAPAAGKSAGDIARQIMNKIGDRA